MNDVRSWHVSAEGSPQGSGEADAPFRSIQQAAERAQAGDRVLIHAGIYRERVDPPRGGEKEAPIVFEAAGDGEAVVCGSEVVKGWSPVGGGSWRVELPATFFPDGNPFDTLIAGDWFRDLGRPHRTGMLFLDGEELMEAASPLTLDPMSWFATVKEGVTRITADFGDRDPNAHLIEATVRSSVFYPGRTGIDYLVIRGLTLRHAATNWAPPTAEQPGLIGTHWSRGWIIEDNLISHSRCVGISLGKYGDEYDNTSSDSAEGYVGTIQRALQRGWNLETVGHHVVRRNRISHCEQAGIVGSLGAVCCVVADNHLHEIHVRRQFQGEEMAAIKFHAPIDSVIDGNHIHHAYRGLWMDWMTQGTRITRNICHHNRVEDLYMEVNHGPCLVDRNVFLSPVSLTNWSEGNAYVHNLFAGAIRPVSVMNRETPFHPAHSTEVAALASIRGGADRFVHNLVCAPETLSAMEGLDRGAHGDRTEGQEVRPSLLKGNEVISLSGWTLFSSGRWVLQGLEGLLDGLPAVDAVTSDTLGLSEPSGLPFESAEGEPLILDRDILGIWYLEETRVAGPFARRAGEVIELEAVCGPESK